MMMYRLYTNIKDHIALKKIVFTVHVLYNLGLTWLHLMPHLRNSH